MNAAASLLNGAMNEGKLECSEEHCGAVTTFMYVLDRRLVLVTIAGFNSAYCKTLWCSNNFHICARRTSGA